MQSLRTRLKQSVREKFGPEALKALKLNLPESLTLTKTPAWLDPKDYNITVKSSEALTQRANSMLAAKYARKFTLEPDDAALVDFSIALRNYLAHHLATLRDSL